VDKKDHSALTRHTCLVYRHSEVLQI